MFIYPKALVQIAVKTPVNLPILLQCWDECNKKRLRIATHPKRFQDNISYWAEFTNIFSVKELLSKIYINPLPPMWHLKTNIVLEHSATVCTVKKKQVN